MFGGVLHFIESSPFFFPGLNGAIRDDFLKVVEVAVWAEALTSIGSAFTKRMIPLQIMAILNNVFGVAIGIGSGSSLSTFMNMP